MTHKTPEQVVQTYLMEAGLKGNLSVLEEIAQPDMVDEANQIFGGPEGREGLVQHVVGFRRAVANVDIQIKRIVAGDSDVMAWWSFSGIHARPWMGREPSGKSISGNVFSFFDLKDGKISRYRLWLNAELADESVSFDSTSGKRP